MNKNYKKVQEVYDWAVDYLMGDKSLSQRDIINAACDVAGEIPELDDIYFLTAPFINMWDLDEEKSVGEAIAEHCDLGDALMEEITGYFGEWLATN